jgi:hypothetical protein
MKTQIETTKPSRKGMGNKKHCERFSGGIPPTCGVKPKELRVGTVAISRAIDDFWRRRGMKTDGEVFQSYRENLRHKPKPGRQMGDFHNDEDFQDSVESL